MNRLIRIISIAVVFTTPALAQKLVDPATVAPALAEELRLMAGWLGLQRVDVAQRGDLAAALEAALG